MPDDVPPEPPVPAPGTEPMPPAPQPAVAAAAIRFCRTCGVAWESAWENCPHCVRADEQRRAGAEGGAPTPAEGYARDVKWVKSSVALYMALLATSLLTIIALSLSEDETAVVTAQFAIGIIDAVIAIAWAVAFRRELGPILRRFAAPRWYAAGVGLALVTFVVASAAVFLLTRVVGVEEIFYTDDFFDAGFGWTTVILLVCVQPGVIEELAFRGVIQTSLMRVLGTYESVFVSALMFGILHLSIPSMPHLFLIGVVLGWMRVKTGSLYPGMLMHFTHNLLVVYSEHSEVLTPW